jgi:hypothetical protein
VSKYIGVCLREIEKMDFRENKGFFAKNTAIE